MESKEHCDSNKKNTIIITDALIKQIRKKLRESSETDCKSDAGTNNSKLLFKQLATQTIILGQPPVNLFANPTPTSNITIPADTIRVGTSITLKMICLNQYPTENLLMPIINFGTASGVNLMLTDNITLTNTMYGFELTCIVTFLTLSTVKVVWGSPSFYINGQQNYFYTAPLSFPTNIDQTLTLTMDVNNTTVFQILDVNVVMDN